MKLASSRRSNQHLDLNPYFVSPQSDGRIADRLETKLAQSKHG